MSAAQQKAQELIDNHAVVLFSKSYCPYCTKAKRIVGGLDLDAAQVGILELDEMGQEGADIQNWLEKQTGQRTVPSVWIKQQFIGGSSDLAAIPEAELIQKVR